MATAFGETGSSLIAFVQQLKGNLVDIELKNSSIVSGQIDYVDASMNTFLRHVKVTAKGKNPVEQDQLMVRGGTIRYFILPPTMSVEDQLKAAAETVSLHRKKGRGVGGGVGVGTSSGKGKAAGAGKGAGAGKRVRKEDGDDGDK